MSSELQRYLTHALGSRLTRLLVYFELLQDRNISEEQRAELIGAMGVQTLRLQHSVSGILASERLTNELPYTARESVALGPLVSRLLHEYQTICPACQFSLNAPSFPVAVQGDAQAIEIIFETLLDNAVQHSPGGGGIEISGEADDERSQLSLHVRDHGEGMSPEKRAGLFAEGAVDPAVRQTRAHGLGLKFAQQLVEALGGEIWVDSEVGRGTTVSFRLPKPPGNEPS